MCSSPPEGYLQRFINVDVVVRTGWGGEFVGTFAGYDEHMNVIIKDALEIRRRPEIEVLFQKNLHFIKILKIRLTFF